MSIHHRNPEITLGSAEHHRLIVLAMIGIGHTADDSDYLNYELDRARIVPDDRLSADIVRMNSVVTYRSDNGAIHTVRLVYPEQGHTLAGSVSVLTPVGTALIGLAAGQTMSWRESNGAARSVTVLSVVNLPAAVAGSPVARRQTPALV